VSVPADSWTNPEIARSWAALEAGTKLGATPFILFPRA
jgi:hypothetical protein